VKNKWAVIIAIIAGLAVIGTLVFFLFLKKSPETVKEEVDLLPPVQVRMLNGCGISGAANIFTDALYYENILVVSTGNAGSFNYNKSVIIVKKDNQIDLTRLMKMTGIEDYTYALSEKETVPFLIIIGKDYEELIKRITSKEKSNR
jgi:hypothetical protein